MELYEAHRQWAHRRDDERFADIDALLTAVGDRYNRSFERADFLFPEIKEVGFDGDDPILVSGQDEAFRFTAHSFRKLCRVLGASAEMLAKLPGEYAARDLEYLLKNRDAHIFTIEDEDARKKAQDAWGKPRKLLALRTEDGLPLIRHIGSNRYGRIWDYDVARWAKEIMDTHGFTVPPSAIKENSGLYAGDESVFVILQDLTKTIEIQRPGDGPAEKLIRGVMVWNSEVGERTFGYVGFVCQCICDNHIIWGAENVAKFETRHVGDAFDRAKESLMPGITAYLNSDTKVETDLLTAAMNTRIASKPDEALDFLRGRKFTKKVAQEALRRARYDEHNEGLDPLSFMAVVNGLTSQARDLDRAMERTDLEQRARGLLQLAMPR